MQVFGETIFSIFFVDSIRKDTDPDVKAPLATPSYVRFTIFQIVSGKVPIFSSLLLRRPRRILAFNEIKCSCETVNTTNRQELNDINKAIEWQHNVAIKCRW